MTRETYKFKTKPFKHQVMALKKLLELGHGGALLMEPRTGKTKVCIDYCSILFQKDKISRVLVVCPVGVMDVWVEEIKAHCPARWRITILDKEGRHFVGMPKFGQGYLDFVIVNYDAFSTPGRMTRRILDKDGKTVSIKRSRVRGGRFEIMRMVQRWMPDVAILDESHRIKSPSAKKSTALVKLGADIEYKILSTGTAVTKKKRIFDLYMQWKFLNPKSPLVANHTAGTFKKEYGVWTERRGYPQWLRERNSKKLHRLVHREAFAVSRDECFDLPVAFPDQINHVNLVEAADTYDRMAEDMVAKIHSGEITQASIKLVLGLRLTQITSGIAKTEPTPDYPSGRVVEIGSEKLRILQSLLEDWFEQDEKIVVCARFRPDIFRIAALAKKLKVEPQVVLGGVSRDERTKQRKIFTERQGASIFIMNPAASSEGIDLRTAATMVWYSLPPSYVHYTQARDRNALSPRAVRNVYLLARGTYDEVQYQALQEDGDVVKAIMASPERLLRNFK